MLEKLIVITNKPSLVRNVYTPGKPADARTCPKNALWAFLRINLSLFIIAVALMVPVCQRDAAKGNSFGLHFVLCIRKLRNGVISHYC